VLRRYRRKRSQMFHEFDHRHMLLRGCMRWVFWEREGKDATV
jgi:hypothetical protein